MGSLNPCKRNTERFRYYLGYAKHTPLYGHRKHDPIALISRFAFP
jgi:hypothetical protein